MYKFRFTRRIVSLILSACLLMTASLNFSLTSAADSDSQETVPSIYVCHTKYDPFFVQQVYLEPETEYIFSYLYSNLPASEDALCYTDSEHRFPAEDRDYSSDENRLIRSFKTVSLDTEGVVAGTGENAGKILSYIGIRMYAMKKFIDRDDMAYLNGKCLYGDFQLYKKSDTSKTNLFTDLSFTNICDNSLGIGAWTSLPAASSNYAQINFTRYDSEPKKLGIQPPKREVYECPFSEKSLRLKSVSDSPSFVQSVWLKPDTEYTFSYLYSKAPASKEIIYKSLSSGEHSITSTYEDTKQKRVYKTFRTASLSDSSAVAGSGENGGLVQAVIGLQFSSDEKNLVGGYYADLRVYEAADEQQKNLFKDQRCLRMGKLSESKIWHGLTNSANAASVMEKASDSVAAFFDKYYTIHTDAVEGGIIAVSREFAAEGDLVTVKVSADNGYMLRAGSVTANGVELSGSNGVYTFECPAENVTVSAHFDGGKEISSICVIHTRFSPYFVQQVYLEPDTEYVFSYLYNNLPASVEAFCYTDKDHTFNAGKRCYSSDEKRLIRSFKTVSLDTEGVVEGTGENAGKILSYIGIRMYALSGNVSADDTRYTDGKCLYADFTLHKADDSKKTNLFYDTAFSDIGHNSAGDGAWTSLPAASSNYAQINFARYDADADTADTQSPRADIYAKNTAYPAVKVSNVTAAIHPFLVQTVWLKPNTTYSYSFMYSDSLPSASIAFKDTTQKPYTLSAPVYDSELNRVTYEFTTGDESDADTVYDSEKGLVKALVGIRIYNSRTDLQGSCFGDFTLVEKGATDKINILSDPDFSDLGAINNSNVWHGLFNNVNTKTSFTKAGDVSRKHFAKSRALSIGFSDNGSLKASASTAKSGETVYLTAIPADGYWFDGYYTDSGTVEKAFGKNSAITVPKKDITVYPIFTEIVKGDSNGDSLCDIRDLVGIKKHLAGASYNIVLENADCNKDGILDSSDNVMIRQRILGIITGIDMVPITGGKINMSLSGGADDKAQALRNKILSSSDNLSRTGTVYYLSENGNDSNSGRSASSPIKTIARLTNLSLKSGDTVLFERGSTFRTTSRYFCTAGVKYGAYGSGEKPKIYGSEKNYVSATWRATSYENIWKTSLSKVASDAGDVGIIAFNLDEAVGTKQYSMEALLDDGYFYYDNSEQAVYLYCSQGNPSSVYSDIEIGRKMNMFTPANGVTLDNLGFFYTGAHAIAAKARTNNVTITNCEIGFIGGSSHMDTRYGNGIQFWEGCENITISNCWIYQVFDAGITFQGFDEEAEYKNITFKNNLIEYCSWSVEWWSGYEKPHVYALSLCDIGEISNILIDSNIMRFEGFGWALSTRKPTSIHGPWGCRTYKNFSDFVVSNNIFDCPNGEFVKWMQSPYLEAQQGYSMVGNSYYRRPTADNLVFFLGSSGETYAARQSQLEKAVKLFDSNPGVIQWME